MIAFEAAWALLKSNFVNYDQGFSGFTPETTAMLPQRIDSSAYDGGNVIPMMTDFNAARQPRPVPQRGQYNDEAAAMFGQGYQSLPMTLEDSLTQAQQNAYAQGNEPQSYGKLEAMNPFNKDPDVQELRRLNQVRAAKDMYARVTPVHRRTQAGLDRAGGVPVQQYHTERAANAFARVNR